MTNYHSWSTWLPAAITLVLIETVVLIVGGMNRSLARSRLRDYDRMLDKREHPTRTLSGKKIVATGTSDAALDSKWNEMLKYRRNARRAVIVALGVALVFLFQPMILLLSKWVFLLLLGAEIILYGVAIHLLLRAPMRRFPTHDESPIE